MALLLRFLGRHVPAGDANTSDIDGPGDEDMWDVNEHQWSPSIALHSAEVVAVGVGDITKLLVALDVEGLELVKRGVAATSPPG